MHYFSHHLHDDGDGDIAADFHLPAHLLSDQRQLLEGAALNCPVYHSLHSDIEKKISFGYDVAGV